MLKRWLTVAVGILVVLGAVLAYSFLREPEAASEPIRAIPVVTDSPANAGSGSLDSAEPTSLSEDVEEGSAIYVFSIDPAESEVRFTLGELLRGAPNTVVGSTNQVAGEIAIDSNALTNTRVGIVRVNARTLETDSDLRDRAIRNRILNSNEFEFISFTPTDIQNLPTGGEFGDSFEIQITGDLTLRNITAQETFEVSVTPISETRIEGYGKATVSRSTYNLTIPSVRDVAEVDEDVILEIEFVAVR